MITLPPTQSIKHDYHPIKVYIEIIIIISCDSFVLYFHIDDIFCDRVTCRVFGVNCVCVCRLTTECWNSKEKTHRTGDGTCWFSRDQQNIFSGSSSWEWSMIALEVGRRLVGWFNCEMVEKIRHEGEGCAEIRIQAQCESRGLSEEWLTSVCHCPPTPTPPPSPPPILSIHTLRWWRSSLTVQTHDSGHLASPLLS